MQGAYPVYLKKKIVPIINISEHLLCAKYQAISFIGVVSFNPHKALWHGYYCNLRYTDVEIEAQRG